MKLLCFLTAHLFIAIGLFAQGHQSNIISGTIIDSSSSLPLEYATVTLFSDTSKKPVTGTVTSKQGKFILNELPDGAYNVILEFIGYNSRKINVLLKNNAGYNVKTIYLGPVQKSLRSIMVVSQSKLVDNKIDKIVYNAERDVTSQSGVATDILKKVPLVSIDVDGNVQLAGSGGIRFLINGKPSTSFGSSIAEVLQSIPASEIKSIEVITNPGAKYDAQGLGGIINIILKSNNTKGYNGNLSLSLGTRTETGSFNINTRTNNFGWNAFISGNKRLNAKTFFSSVRSGTDSFGTTILKQEGEGLFERDGLQAGTGFDWSYKKINNFSESFVYNQFENRGQSMTNQNFEPNIDLSLINANNKFVSKNIDLELNYKRTFSKEDQELEFSLNTSFGNDHNRSFNEQFLLPQDSLYYGTASSNPGKTSETEISLDYTQPLKEDITLGMGSKVSFNNINSVSDIQRLHRNQQAYVSDPSLANNLKYDQKVYAFYSELSFPVVAGIKAKVGGRYERTEINSFYANAQQQVNVPGYNTFVPSIFFSKKIADDQTLKLSYSKRIERPDYEDLNPFVNTNDPKNLFTGNPFLLPELGHRIELGYSRATGKKGSVMFNIFYRINARDIQPYILYYASYQVGDSIYNNVAINTRRNIGSEQNLGMNIFGDLHLTPKLNIRGNVFLFRRHTINIINSGYNYNSFNYRINMNGSYQFTTSLLAEFFGNFNAARHEAQGSYPSFTTYSLAVRKQFWNKKASIALTGNNFLNKYVIQRTKLTGPGFALNGTRKIPFRSVSLNFTWKFGKLEFKKNKPENDFNANLPADQ